MMMSSLLLQHCSSNGVTGIRGGPTNVLAAADTIANCIQVYTIVTTKYGRPHATIVSLAGPNVS